MEWIRTLVAVAPAWGLILGGAIWFWNKEGRGW
jgi:hypothetical protein